MLTACCPLFCFLCCFRLGAPPPARLLHRALNGGVLSPIALSLAVLRCAVQVLEDECGAPPGRSAVSERGELMVAGPEAVYFYTGGWAGGQAGGQLRASVLRVKTQL